MQIRMSIILISHEKVTAELSKNCLPTSGSEYQGTFTQCFLFSILKCPAKCIIKSEYVQLLDK